MGRDLWIGGEGMKILMAVSNTLCPPFKTQNSKYQSLGDDDYQLIERR